MILIAIGANLPAFGRWAPLVTCRAAAEALRSLPDLRVIAVSRWFRTAAVPPSDQPDYVNGVVRMEGTPDPAALLARLQAIEARAGRVRAEANAARTLDLDIVDLNGLLRDAPDPVLPHPRAHSRGFVLWPLRDVAPEWVHPRLGVGVETLLGRLAPQSVTPL